MGTKHDGRLTLVKNTVLAADGDEPFHRVARIFPDMDDEQFKVLFDDIEVHGQHEPILMFEGLVADGRHRWLVCRQLGIEPKTIEWKGTEAELERRVISANLARNHLDADQRAPIAAKYATMPRGTNRHTVGAAKQAGALTKKEAAERFNVSVASIGRVDYAKSRGCPELVAAVDKGLVNPRLAKDIAKLPLAEQPEAVGRALSKDDKQSIRKLHAAMRKSETVGKRKTSQAEIDARRAEPGAFPGGPFGIAVIDSPWDYENAAKSSHCNPAYHYPLMSIDEIAALPVKDMLHKDALAFVWTTSMHLAACIREVLPAWGLEYHSCAVWNKPKAVVGAGVLRMQHEFLVVARRGKGLGQPTRQLPSVFEAPQGRHSEKPALVQEWIEEAFPEITSRVELFARDTREGWASWGNDPALAKKAA